MTIELEQRQSESSDTWHDGSCMADSRGGGFMHGSSFVEFYLKLKTVKFHFLIYIHYWPTCMFGYIKVNPIKTLFSI